MMCKLHELGRKYILIFLLLTYLIKYQILQRMGEKSLSSCRFIKNIGIILSFTLIVFLLTHNNYSQDSFIEASYHNIQNTNRILFTTNTTRNSLVSKYCSSSPDAILQSERDTNSMYNSSLSSYFHANATTLVNALFKSQISTFVTQLQISGTGTFVFIAPFAIGLALLMFSWPFFVCCCICQNDCPAKCCRNKNRNYSNQELIWPTVFLVITSLIIIATAIPSLTNSTNFFTDFSCRTAQLLDNFQNGNQTSSGNNFFAGITTIRSQLADVLSPALTQVSSQITRLIDSVGSILQTAKNDATSAYNSMKNLPNGINTLPLTLAYNYPLQTNSATDTLPSYTAELIGAYNIAGSLLSNLYNYVYALQGNLSAITTASSGVNPSLNAGDMGAHISATNTVLTSVQTDLTGINTSLQTVLSLLTTIDSYNLQYSRLLYGITLGLACFTLVCIVIMKCFNAICCRHFLYLNCIAIFIITAILFTFTIILSIAMTTTYYTCSYISTTFTNPITFTNTVNNLLGSQYSNIPNYFSQCFGGNNDFLSPIDPILSGYFTQLKTAVFNSYLYNFTDLTYNLNNHLTTIQTAINEAGYGHIPDFSTSTTNGQAQITFFNSVASKSIFTSSCPSSSYAVFHQDVWVPGLSSTFQQLVPCGGKLNQNSSTCSSGISNTASCPSSRCIDTFSIISLYYRNTNINNLIPDANTRYGAACTPFNDYMTNFFNNYVKIVNDKIGNTAQDSSDTTKLAGRFISTTSTPVQTLLSYMTTNVQPLFNQVYGNLTTTYGLNSIFNPKTGLITGFDCRVLSENGVNMQQAFCIRSLNRIFFTLVTVGIMAFAMFLLLCCILCFNVRHYQYSLQFQSKTRINPLQVEESQSQSVIKMR